MTIEKSLGVLAADEADSRIELVQVAEEGSTPTLELRFQRYADDFGWLTHRRMRLAPGQVSDLKSALALMDVDARQAKINPSQKAQARGLRLVNEG